MLLAVLLAALTLAGLGLLGRHGVNTPLGLHIVQSQVSGLKIGRYGRLRIEGLGGDLWHDVTASRVYMTDDKGVWLDARDVKMAWRPLEFLARRYHAERIDAGKVVILRRPSLGPRTAPRPIPISVRIDAINAPLETREAFSFRKGSFGAVGSVNVVRKGSTLVVLKADSRLHAGDRFHLTLQAGAGRPLVLLIDASEASGGAIAGSLGLAADKPFLLKADLRSDRGQGRLDVLARSGAAIPARATGAWNAAGGSVNGRLALSASRLTLALARRFGPEVTFQGTGRRTKGGFYAINALADSETLHATARGEAHLHDVRTKASGLEVTFATDHLEQVALAGLKGGARSRGRLRIDDQGWAYEGDVTGQELGLLGYDLARASGPVKVARRKGELTIESELAGSGGRGGGYLGALLGDRPRGEVTAVRLRDGRLLLRRITTVGTGVKLDATGERTLLGGLSFKGDADLTNLVAAGSGSKGRVRAGWTASQGGAERPWVFTLDARGADFATGRGELDRLLGSTPRFTGKGEYRAGLVTVADARLDGTAGSARASGGIGPAGALKLALSWDAKGPFRAGPVEVAGAMRGTGSLGGSLAAPRADLTADFDNIDIPRLALSQAHVTLSFLRGPGGTDGQFAIAAGSDYGPARAVTSFRFAPGGVELTGLDADAGGVKASGSLSLRSAAPATADLTLAIGPGALLTQGQISGSARVVDAPGGPRATLDLNARNAVVRGGGGLHLAALTLTADGPLERLPISLDGRGTYGVNRWRFKGGGNFAQRGAATGLALDGEGRFASADFRTLETARIGFGGGQRFADLLLEVEGGRAQITARMDRNAAQIQAAMTDVSLGAVNEDLAGVFDATVSLMGKGEHLTGAMNATLKDARARGAPRTASLNAEVKALLGDQGLDVDARATNAGGLKAEAVLTLPVAASAAPLRLAIARRQPVKGRFSADGEIKPLWDLLVGGERTVSGDVSVAATMGGTLVDPLFEGHASLQGGTFEDGVIGLKLRGLGIDADLANEQIDVSRFSAIDGRGGGVEGSGRISLKRNGEGSFKVALDQFQLFDNDTATATATGEATLSRASDGKVQLVGDLRIDRADIAADPPTPSGVVPMAVIERNKPVDDEVVAPAEARRGLVVGLDVSLKADRGIFIKGRGLNAELALDAHVRGTTAAPVLDGEAQIVRGDYEFAGKRFDFEDRSRIYLASRADRIRLDLTASREDTTLTAVIRVRGTAARPEITLTSSPVLPADEVLSRVLFGASASQLSPLEAAQLASALAALAGGGGFDVIGNLKSFAGLDRLVFAGGGSTGAMTVAGGKYITDDVYLEIIGGGREGPAAQVEWRVRRTLSIISRLQGEDRSKLSVRWRKDY